MTFIGICLTCKQPLNPILPCDCFGDYKVGEIYERKEHEYRIMSKHYNMDDDGSIDGCVYLVGVRMFGSIYINHLAAYDGYYSGYTKVANWRL